MEHENWRGQMKANWKKVGVDPGPELGMWVLVVVQDREGKRSVEKVWCTVDPNLTSVRIPYAFYLPDIYVGRAVTHWDYMPGLPEEEG
jgi:hypothetical protein